MRPSGRAFGPSEGFSPRPLRLSAALLAVAFLVAAPPSAHAQAAAGITVSDNPVRTPPVTLSWPAGAASVRVVIFTQLGTRILDATLPSDPGQYAWDLRTQGGDPVANGAYLVVVTRSDGVRYRRRLLVAR